jgi:hypothetical protein
MEYACIPYYEQAFPFSYTSYPYKYYPSSIPGYY